MKGENDRPQRFRGLAAVVVNRVGSEAEKCINQKNLHSARTFHAKVFWEFFARKR